MDFVQGTITTVHDFGRGTVPEPDGSFAAVVPMTERELERPTAAGVVRAALRAGAERVLVPLRADRRMAVRMAAWLRGIDPDVEVLWCNAPPVVDLLDANDLTPRGKGGDVWLALGPAARNVDAVCLFDADVDGVGRTSYERLLAPLDGDVTFSKAYYARIEGDRLYGRLFRLLFRPLVRSMWAERPDPLLAYLGTFRYALSGEFAVDAEVALDWSLPMGMGLEVATLGEAFASVGPSKSAQVDLGIHRHDHRPVDGDGGLADIAPEIVGTLADVLDRQATDPVSLPDPRSYREAATALIERYRRDARGNGLVYDADAERMQVERYAEAVANPDPSPRLPPWTDVTLEAAEIVAVSDEALGLHANPSGNT